jgi:hypothetical protein
MDDLFVIWLSNKLVRRLVNAEVLADCRARAAAVSFSIGFSGTSFYARHEEPAVADPSGAAGREVPAPAADATPKP